MKEFFHEYADIWHNVPSAMQTMAGMWVVRAGRNEAKPTYHVGPRMIECHSLHFVTEGKVSVQTDGEETDLQKGDLFCLFPRTAYTYKTVSPASRLRLVWLALNGRQMPHLIGLIGLAKETPYLKQALTREVRRTLKQLLGLFEKNAFETLLCQSLLYRLFDELKAGKKTDSRGERKDWLQQSIEYFHLHYTEGIKIDTVAKLCGIHRSHFTAMFAKETGVPPVRYLQRLRMDKGALLLKETSLNVTEIALSLGFSDLFSFTRAFTNYFGVSPSHYRRGLTVN